MDIESLNLKATTPLDLFFESVMKGLEEHLDEIFKYFGYTEDDVNSLEPLLDARDDFTDDENMAFVREIAVRLDCLEDYTKLVNEGLDQE